MMKRVLLLLACLGLMMACGGTEEPADTGTPINDTVVADTAEPPPCDYTDDLAGKNVGDLVENIKVKDSDGNKYELHSNCGAKKAVWVILSTGW